MIIPETSLFLGFYIFVYIKKGVLQRYIYMPWQHCAHSDTPFGNR